MGIFGGDTGERFLIAILSVALALIAFTAILWFIRSRPVAPLLTRSMREREKRLTVIDAAVVDSKRRIVLVRRDGVEHLLLIGGPQDVVIESGIGLEKPVTIPDQRQYQSPQQNRTRPQPQETAPEPVRQHSRPAPAQMATPAAAPSEDTDFLYGPNAIHSAREFEQERPNPLRADTGPLRTADQLRKRTANYADLADISIDEESAESILAMLRARVLGDDKEEPAVSRNRASAATRSAQQNSSFANMLENIEDDEEYTSAARAMPSQAPKASHSRTSAMGRINPTRAPNEATSAVKSESLRREKMLETEMTRILQEMQMKRAK